MRAVCAHVCVHVRVCACVCLPVGSLLGIAELARVWSSLGLSRGRGHTCPLCSVDQAGQGHRGGARHLVSRKIGVRGDMEGVTISAMEWGPCVDADVMGGSSPLTSRVSVSSPVSPHRPRTPGGESCFARGPAWAPASVTGRQSYPCEDIT